VYEVFEVVAVTDVDIAPDDQVQLLGKYSEA
jgi:hypothetical protein